ncbi:FkbM family methyltransferase [Halorubrum ezzemoulense]|uniref:FkbM family methyltransferase n=1 Tax=Halorubrum ezzemoulense TaxID=337243 RepID=UPI00232D8FDD|nr:FkbM family methyltransferase [Halorubrum ezzemoulense]MDB2243106.1 FkbM family methyltransferase [Halorubrum ezzemoulense]
MSSLLRKAAKIYQDHGFLDLAYRGSRFLASQILCEVFNIPSRKIGVYNGVSVRKDVLLRPDDVHPSYEKALINQIRNTVETGEKIVVIGGGNGVSTTVAARRAGVSGQVISYEGSEKHVKIVRETTVLNKISDRVTVKHAIVSDAYQLFSEAGTASRIEPSALPECDVIVMDCEGSELDILRNMSVQPRAVIVETHAFLDSPEHKIRKELSKMNYSVVDRGVEDKQAGVYVLSALYNRDGE